MIEFLIVDGTSPVEIHRCLRSICGENAVDVSSVRCWVGYCMNREKDPAAADQLQQQQWRTKTRLMRLFGMTTREFCAATGIEKPMVMVVVSNMGTGKFAQ